MHHYKIVFTQELKSNDHILRREFADWAIEHLEHDPDFGQIIIFSDEDIFDRLALLIGKIAVIDAKTTQKCSMKFHCIPKNSLCCTDYGMAASSDLISFEMRIEQP